MTKVSNQMISCELMENSGIEYAHCDMIDSDIAPLEDKKAVFHDAEAHITLWIASIGKLILVE